MKKNDKDKDKQINAILNNAIWLLIIGILVIIFTPFIFTRELFLEKLDFSKTGEIGDTIGGITSPFLNLIGAFLVFYALKAQVKANELIQNQIDNENNEKECENETNNLNLLFSYLNESINNFQFNSLPIEDLRNIDEKDTIINHNGGDAFFALFSQIRCHYHGTENDLKNNQSVSELISILEVMDLLLIKLKVTKSKNKEILTTLIKHLFEYKIITRIRDEDNDELIHQYCNICDCNHGLPKDLHKLISSIREKIN